MPRRPAASRTASGRAARDWLKFWNPAPRNGVVSRVPSSRSRGSSPPKRSFPCVFRPRSFWLLFLSLGLAASALAQGTGRSLDIQPGARQNALGAAGVALAEDATGVTWWNPAALGFVKKSAIELTYAQLVPGPGDRRELQLRHVREARAGLGRGRRSGSSSCPTAPATRPTSSGTSIGSFTSNEVSPARLLGHAGPAGLRDRRLAQVHPHPAGAVGAVGRRLHVRPRPRRRSTASRPRG